MCTFSAPDGGCRNHGYPWADVLPFALPRGGGKGLWVQWEWGSDPSAAGTSQLRDLELELSGSAPVFSHSESSVHPRGLGVRAPADVDGSAFPAPLGSQRLLLAGHQLCAQALAGTQPTAAALLRKSSSFLLAC